MFNAPSGAAAEAADVAAGEAALDAAELLGTGDADEPEEQAARPIAATEATAMQAVILAQGVIGEG